MAAELEKAGNDRNTKFIREYTDPMLAKYELYEPFLDKILNPGEASEADKKAEDKPAAESTILTDLFNTMIEALDNLDIDEMENVINELDKYSYDESQTGLLEQLRTEVANIDIDKCDKIIDEWKALLK